jgi:hypothetical protein
MIMKANPYAEALGARAPLDVLADTPGRIRQLVERWGNDHFERSYAAGKWSARKILIHLVQTELALGARVRFALTQDLYSAQAFSQDDWLPLDEHVDARAALDAYTTLRRFTLTMFRNLSRDQLNRTFQHPEYGELTVGWVMAQMAGHDLHHLRQLEHIH